MRVQPRVICPAIAMALLVGCATAPETTNLKTAVAPPVAPIAVSCQTGSLSDQPCIAIARQSCPDPAVDTIHLVLATPVSTDSVHTSYQYEYRATYNCPGQSVGATL